MEKKLEVVVGLLGGVESFFWCHLSLEIANWKPTPTQTWNLDLGGALAVWCGGVFWFAALKLKTTEALEQSWSLVTSELIKTKQTWRPIGVNLLSQNHEMLLLVELNIGKSSSWTWAAKTIWQNSEMLGFTSQNSGTWGPNWYWCEMVLAINDREYGAFAVYRVLIYFYIRNILAKK